MKPTAQTAERLAVVRAMAARGLRDRRIAAELEMSVATVSKLRSRYGIPPVPRTGPTHGLRSTYVTYGCRCDACTAANTQAAREARKRMAARRDTATFKHGVSGYGNWSCRCEVCSAAWRERCREYGRRRRAAKAVTS